LNEQNVLASISQIEQFITNHRFSFVYIMRTNCSVCHALFPQLKNVLEDFPDIQLGVVNADDVPEVAGYLSIFTAPVMILFMDRKEVLREARFVHLDVFREKLKKIYELSH
jgi:thioredoxin-like negative regulator of GroEL